MSLMMGVLLFTEPIWRKADAAVTPEGGNVILGTAAVMIEVTLSGFASIYFEKVIKTDPEQLGIWERNYQLAFGSIPVYVAFILWDGGGEVGYLGGWSVLSKCRGADLIRVTPSNFLVHVPCLVSVFVSAKPAEIAPRLPHLTLNHFSRTAGVSAARGT